MALVSGALCAIILVRNGEGSNPSVFSSFLLFLLLKMVDVIKIVAAGGYVLAPSSLQHPHVE